MNDAATTLITRHAGDLLGGASAVFSGDGTYRYVLTRTWGPRPYATWVMLNPSMADESVNDPTILRCIDFTRRWGMGGLTVVNLYALRSANPAALTAHPDPVGEVNDQIIAANCDPQQIVIAAWGAGFPDRARPAKVAGIIAAAGCTLLCLGVTGEGHPKHPLARGRAYIRPDTLPVPYQPPWAA